LTRLTNDSADYTAAREELRLAEIELMRQRERVAALRRDLPAGAVVQDYVLQEGPASLDDGDAPARSVRLSELFTGSDRPLVVYHLMYGKLQTTPCPMCTTWIDGYNGIARHVEQNVDFVIAAAADLRMADDIDERGIDLLCPLWHIMDLTPAGRGDWYPDLTYPEPSLERVRS
jgi:predicted dithiol-disulfide oxidoreductase (DUF899 family)